MNKAKYRKAWLRAHKTYERKSSALLRKYFKEQALKVPYIFLDEENYKASIADSVEIGGLYNVYFEIYKIIGLIHGDRIGKGINRNIKEFNNVIFQTEYQRGLYQWVIENIGHRIVSVRAEYIKHIQRMVAEGFKQGFTTRELAAQIQRMVNRRDFYRYQALRIARTESSLAANRAAMIAGKTSGIVHDKVWISIPDERTRGRNPNDRWNHVVMDGVKVGEDEYFNIQGELLAYPSAATTKEGNQSSAGNVINCRCTAALIPRRDANGRIIRTGVRPIPVRQPIQRPIRVPVQTTPRGFIPASTKVEAERRIMKLGVEKVNLRGLNKDQYNMVLKTMEEEAKFAGMSLKELAIVNSKRSNNNGTYFTHKQKITLNLAHNRNFKKHEAVPYKKQISKFKNMHDEVVSKYLGNERYIQSNVKRKLRAISREINKLQNKIDAGEVARSWSVSSSQDNALESMRTTLIHEMGHHRQWRQVGRKTQYVFDPKLSISEYGRTNREEYFVEWYAQWRLYGDKGVPKDLLRLFKLLQI